MNFSCWKCADDRCLGTMVSLLIGLLYASLQLPLDNRENKNSRNVCLSQIRGNIFPRKFLLIQYFVLRGSLFPFAKFMQDTHWKGASISPALELHLKPVGNRLLHYSSNSLMQLIELNVSGISNWLCKALNCKKQPQKVQVLYCTLGLPDFFNPCHLSTLHRCSLTSVPIKSSSRSLQTS